MEICFRVFFPVFSFVSFCLFFCFFILFLFFVDGCFYILRFSVYFWSEGCLCFVYCFVDGFLYINILLFIAYFWSGCCLRAFVPASQPDHYYYSSSPSYPRPIIIILRAHLYASFFYIFLHYTCLQTVNWYKFTLLHAVKDSRTKDVLDGILGNLQQFRKAESIFDNSCSVKIGMACVCVYIYR